MIRRFRRPAPRRGEHGFTLTEVVLVVVMIGLIAVPLTAALMQAIRLVPESGARTKASVDRVFLADQFSADLTNGSTITAGTLISESLFTGQYNQCGSERCVAAYCTGSATGTRSLLFTSTWSDGTKVSYALKVFALTAPQTTNTAQLVREETPPSGGVMTSKTVAEGYCASGGGGLLSGLQPWPARAWITTPVKGGRQRVRISLKLKARQDGPVEVFNFEGSLRRTTPT